MTKKGTEGEDGTASVTSSVCRLCLATGCEPAGRNKHREFVHCPSCGLVTVPREFWVNEEQERARYAHHDNSPANEGYVKFLGQVADVVAGLGMAQARVLDFGSGPSAVLADILRQRGFDCAAYDPVYGLGQAALRQRYDIVVLCEVIEHLRDVRGELRLLKDCLGPGGRVVVRTQCYPSLAGVPTWWYARDATHLNFFCARTLEFAAGLCGLRCVRTGAPDIFVWAAEP